MSTGIPAFAEKLENEEQILDAILSALAKEQLPEDAWENLHGAAVRDERISELAFAYEAVAQGRRLKAQPPAVQAEFLYRAATFFGDVLGDEFGATTYLERALGAQPGHVGAFERIDAQLTASDDNKKLAELCAATAPHRDRDDQVQLLRRAAVLFERAGQEDRSLEIHQQLVRLEPADERFRAALEGKLLKANRHRDVARMLEQALAHDPPLPADQHASIREKLIDVFANQLKEPERALPHVEALLAEDPHHPEARRVATRLLEVRGLASRAAGALSPGATTTEERAHYLSIELEHTRGPKRRDVLRRIGEMRQDELGDPRGAMEAFEQALSIDPADDELRARYVTLAMEIKGPAETARTFARVSTVAKDAGVRSRITAEMGELLLRAGDAKRARTTLVGVLQASSADTVAVLTAARALETLFDDEKDAKSLADVLARIGESSPDEEEAQRANERLAELCQETLKDTERAIGAWRRLVDTPSRARALAALEPLYEQRSEWIDLSFVLEERAKDEPDPAAARELSFRAAEVLTTKARDAMSASEAWRQLIEKYGPARDAFAQWMPLLEAQRQWPELASALRADAELAPREECGAVLAKLAQVYLQRIRDIPLAIETFQLALEVDPQEPSSRATLEKLLMTGDHRLEAASVLEPFYRAESDSMGLLRTLDIRAQLSPIVHDRLAALEEAAQVAEVTSTDKALELVARGLAESVESQEPLLPWLRRFDELAEGIDPKRRAQMLGKSLGDQPVTSLELLELAKRIGEEHATSGDVASALEVYRRALAFDASSSELIARVDDLLREQGNPAERVALYRAAIEQSPPPPRRKQLLHSIGTIERYELENAPAAIEAYRLALADDAADVGAFAALVELYTECQRWDDLCDVLEDHLPECQPAEARTTRAKLADVAARHGRPETAIVHACALLSDGAAEDAQLAVVQDVAKALGDTELLRSVLERRTKEAKDPRGQVGFLEALGQLALDTTADKPVAIEHFRRAAAVAARVGEEAEAIALSRRVLELDPDDAEAARTLVDLLEGSEKWDEAAPLYKMLVAAAEETTERVELLRKLAHVLGEHVGDIAGAFEATLRAFEMVPTDRDVLGELTDLARASGRTGDFASAIDAALAGSVEPGSPMSTELLLAKGRVLSMEEGKKGDAKRAFRAVLERGAERDPSNLAATAYGALLREEPPGPSKTEELRWLAAWRVETAEEGTSALASWANLEENEIGDADAALALWRRVLEVEADNMDALAAVSRLSLAMGDVEGALGALVTRRDGAEGEARSALDVQIATILLELPGREAEAVDHVAGVLATTPHEPTALALATRMLSIEGLAPRITEALERALDSVDDETMREDILRRLIAQAPAQDALLGYYQRLADLLSAQDRGADSLETLIEAARALPSTWDLWDRAEGLARTLSTPDPVAALFEDVISRDLEPELALELGQRAVAFYEEWYEDGIRVVRVLQRVLDLHPADSWAFDRLKLLFDAQERWDELFALYDRVLETADRDRKVELLEDAAQIAKDFANHSARAIGYLEQLLELKPDTARLSNALERLYERHGCHRELITLLSGRLPQLEVGDAQKERIRIATLWLEELGDAANALLAIEEILANESAPGADVDATPLLERVLAVAPPTTEARESVAPPNVGEGRRDSFAPVGAPKRMLVRQRAAALLKERYAGGDRDADLVRVLEVELEAVKSAKERIRRHQQIAGIYASLGNDESALEHFVQLVLLEPEVASHRAELSSLAEKVGRHDRLAEVLISAADDCNDDALRVELLAHAGAVLANQIGDSPRAIDLFFRVLRTPGIADDALLAACRQLEPLLDTAGRRSERLDVLERLAILEQNGEERAEVLRIAALLATDLEEDERAVWAWEGRLETLPEDPDALDGLVALFEKARKWRPLIGVLARRAKLPRSDEARRSDRVRAAVVLSQELQETEEAIAGWRGVEEEFGESDEGIRALSSLYRSAGRWSDLAQLLARAAERTDDPADKSEVLRELGDVQREQLEQLSDAIASYEASLSHDPRAEGSRSGLRAMLKPPEHRAEVVRVLLSAYQAADDWRLILDLTEHRLNAARGASAQVTILMEAAELSETRASDLHAAFALVRRAFLLAPSDADVEAQLFRTGELARSWKAVAEALKEVVDAHDEAGASPPWLRGLRYRMGVVLEERLEDPRAALDAYSRVAGEDGSNLDAVRATIRAGGRTARWDTAAQTLIDAARALDALAPELVAAVEETATSAGAWDAATGAITALIERTHELPASLARDLDAQLAAWHRDQRSDPDAAEAAYARALTHDPQNTELLAQLAELQRRAKGRPLVDSLLRLSQATGGDLDLLVEAAEVALVSVADRALARSILERLLTLGTERWTGDEWTAPSAGTPKEPSEYVAHALRELVKIHDAEGDLEKVMTLLLETARLPWSTERSREMRHEAATIANERIGAPERAIAVYLGLIDDEPHDTRAVDALVAIYESLDRRTDLLELKQRLVGVSESVERRVTLRLEVSALQDAMGDGAGATETLRQNLTEEARHPATVDRLVQLFTRESKYEELDALLSDQAELSEVAGDDGGAADRWAHAARVAEDNLGDTKRAIAHLQRVTKLEPRVEAFDALARLATSRKDHAGAAGYLDRLRELVPAERRPETVIRLADALVAAGDQKRARARLEEAVAADPEADTVRVRLARMYRNQSEWSALAALLTSGAEHAPDKEKRLTRLREAADLHRTKTGQPEAAIPLLEQACDLAPDNGRLRLLLADALGAAKRFDEARGMLRTIIDGFGGRRPKERAPVHYHLARLDLAMGDRPRALLELDAATKIDPANPEILQALAELARDDGQFDRAERSYRALLTVLRRQHDDPDEEPPITRSEVFFELSTIAARQGETDRANEILESALELAAESPLEARRFEGALRTAGDAPNLARAIEARLARGVEDEELFILTSELAALLEGPLGRREDALEMRLRALTADPRNAEEHATTAELARSLDKLGAYQDKLNEVARDAEDRGDVDLASELFQRLARLEEEAPDHKAAAKLYERALELTPRDRELLAALDRVFEQLGDDAGQARVLGMRVDLDAEEGGVSAEALYRLASLQLRSAETLEAGCNALEGALEREPDLDRALEMLQQAADAHPTHVTVVTLFERIAREPGRERTLVEALTRVWSLPGASTDPMREAVGLAQALEDRPLAESLLRRMLERGDDDVPARVWALSLLAELRLQEEDGVREAVLLKREAADIAEPDDARRLLFEVAGHAATQLGDLHLAASIYEDLHERDPADRDAWQPLLDVYRRMDDYEKLSALIAQVVELVDDVSERSKLRLERVRIGMQKLALGDDDATNELRDIVDDDPGQADAAILLGSIFERNGREQDLAELLARQLDIAKDRQDAASVASLSERLGLLLERQDPAEARSVYYAALDWEPSNKKILLSLERLHEADGETLDRADVIERRLVHEKGPEAEALSLSLAELRRTLEDADGALRALELGFKAFPQSETLKSALEKTYREAMEYQRLAELYRTDAAGREDPRERAARLREAAHLYKEELSDPELAAAVLREAREADAEDLDLLRELVDTLTASGELAAAGDELTGAIDALPEDDPRRPELVGQRAPIRARLSDFPGALDDFELAVAAGVGSLRPKLAEHLGKMALSSAGKGDPAAWRKHKLRLAGLQLEMGAVEEARDLLTELLKTDTRDRDVLRAIAYVDELEERWDAASATYRRLVGLEEGEAVVTAALKLAETCEKAGRPADARGGLERARMAAPQDPRLRQRLAHLYEATGALKELAQMCMEEARAAGDVAGCFENLVRAGQLFLEYGQEPDLAVTPLEEAHALRPADLDCAALLSDAYAASGRLQDATDLLERTIATFKGRRARELSALFHRLARISEAQGDRQKELGHLQTALEMDAQNGVVASEMAYLAMELAQWDTAQRALRAVTMLKAPAPLPKALAYQHLGEIARQQGDLKRAVVLLKRAIDDDPSLESARALLDALQHD
ncbi:MAG: tetratricopeptide repeat protein [Myxococcales bacterium]|nr:tetratricopeptide repeat protein [Myxococcales bacterium]